MMEAVRILAAEKGISDETLLQVPGRRPRVRLQAPARRGRRGEVEIDPDTCEMRFIAYDIDEDGNWVDPRDDTPTRATSAASPPRRSAR